MNVEVNNFNGPLDLLLHLIRSNKMDIYDIDIELINRVNKFNTKPKTYVKNK